MIDIKKIVLSFFIFFFSCEEAEYQLNNPSDPFNMDLAPPALFIHPSERVTSVNDTFSIEVYGLDLDSLAGAHIAFEYDRGCDADDSENLCNRIDSINPGLLFIGGNEPIITQDEDEKAKPDIYLFYLPDMYSDQSEGGTGPLAKIYFTAGTRAGQFELRLAEQTKLRDKNNNDLPINELRGGAVIVE